MSIITYIFIAVSFTIAKKGNSLDAHKDMNR